VGGRWTYAISEMIALAEKKHSQSKLRELASENKQFAKYYAAELRARFDETLVGLESEVVKEALQQVQDNFDEETVEAEKKLHEAQACSNFMMKLSEKALSGKPTTSTKQQTAARSKAAAEEDEDGAYEEEEEEEEEEDEVQVLSPTPLHAKRVTIRKPRKSSSGMTAKEIAAVALKMAVDVKKPLEGATKEVGHSDENQDDDDEEEEAASNGRQTRKRQKVSYKEVNEDDEEYVEGDSD
jgi:hypothetical protein